MRPALFIALSLLALTLLGAVWQPYPPNAVDMLAKNLPPSPEHLLGTDQLGRDLASRMLLAGWRSLLVVLIVGVVGFVGGTLVGCVSTMTGGLAEWLLLRGAEMFIVVPTLIWALTAAALFELTANSLTRRALGFDYVRVARALGVPPPGILLRHILPTILPLMLARAGAQAGQAVVAYAGLAFIGLGVDPSRPDWGAMLFEYRMFLFEAPRLVVVPGLAIALMALAINLLADPE